MNLEEFIKKHATDTPITKALGIHIIEAKNGYAKAKMEISETHSNPIGSIHGGCLFTLADVTGGTAACTHGNRVTTVDANIHYLRAGMNTSCLYGEARELKCGKNIMVYEVSLTDQDNLLLADGIFTYMSLGKTLE